jgi:glycosyltransferase involved in cell wall biosynthesis
MRKSPMKIVILVHVLSVGGAERQFIQLAEELRRRGHDVRIVALHVSNPGWRWMQQAEGVLATALFDQVPEGPLESIRQFISAIRQLRQLFSEHQTQIAHAGNTGLIATLLWFATRGRSLPSMVWGQLGGFGLARRGPRALHHTLAARFSRAVSHSAALLLANSDAGSRALQRDGLRCRRFEVVPNGIDISHFERDDRAG